jgi:hypothetical protein
MVTLLTREHPRAAIIMRELSESKKGDLERRKSTFNEFFQESMPVLVDFIERLELPDAWRVVHEPDLFLAAVDAWMSKEEISPEDWVWILTRIGYFIGYLFTQRLGGYRLVDENPDSPYFAHYVVGGLSRLPNPNQAIEPFALAANYLSLPIGRSLVGEVNRLEKQLWQR